MDNSRLQRILERERLLAEKLKVQSAANPTPGSEIPKPSRPLRIPKAKRATDSVSSSSSGDSVSSSLPSSSSTVSAVSSSSSSSSSSSWSTPSPWQPQSFDSLEAQVANIRWQKNKEGSWSSKTKLTAHAYRQDASNEAHCYKLVANSTELPTEVNWTLQLGSVIEECIG